MISFESICLSFETLRIFVQAPLVQGRQLWHCFFSFLQGHLVYFTEHVPRIPQGQQIDFPGWEFENFVGLDII